MSILIINFEHCNYQKNVHDKHNIFPKSFLCQKCFGAPRLFTDFQKTCRSLIRACVRENQPKTSCVLARLLGRLEYRHNFWVFLYIVKQQNATWSFYILVAPLEMNTPCEASGGCSLKSPIWAVSLFCPSLLLLLNAFRGPFNSSSIDLLGVGGDKRANKAKFVLVKGYHQQYHGIFHRYLSRG